VTKVVGVFVPFFVRRFNGTKHSAGSSLLNIKGVVIGFREAAPPSLD
jgi:hypothetical protein